MQDPMFYTSREEQDECVIRRPLRWRYQNRNQQGKNHKCHCN